jgi:hypothetical protein
MYDCKKRRRSGSGAFLVLAQILLLGISGADIPGKDMDPISDLGIGAGEFSFGIEVIDRGYDLSVFGQMFQSERCLYRTTHDGSLCRVRTSREVIRRFTQHIELTTKFLELAIEAGGRIQTNRILHRTKDAAIKFHSVNPTFCRLDFSFTLRVRIVPETDASTWG